MLRVPLSVLWREITTSGSIECDGITGYIRPVRGRDRAWAPPTWQYTVRMPLSAEFRHHLHELMVEVSDKLRDDLNDHKRKLISEAQQTHNAAAIPGAYSKASLPHISFLKVA
jgi:hypothetical protein